jgi:hypothetical protein
MVTRTCRARSRTIPWVERTPLAKYSKEVLWRLKDLAA